MTQINPPFDGSDPCPMCQMEVRNVGALLHNFAVRWPEPKAFVKLNDLRRTVIPEVLTVPSPETTEEMAVARALVEACKDMTDEGGMIRWTPETVERVGVLVDRVKKALAACESLSDAHFHDQRHSSGRENFLATKTGAHGIPFLRCYSYDYRVEPVDGAGDIRHTVCGQGYRLDEYFLADLRRDPAFFGRMWCKTCNQNVPLSQFEGAVLAA